MLGRRITQKRFKRKAICYLNGEEESQGSSYGRAYKALKAFGLIGEIGNRFDAH